MNKFHFSINTEYKKISARILKIQKLHYKKKNLMSLRKHGEYKIFSMLTFYQKIHRLF